jgi:CRP-like cAMP-binding protein
MPKDPRIELLRSVPLFMDCKNDQLAFIATQVEDDDVKAGEVLCTEDTNGGDFFVIVSGTARVERKGKLLSMLGPGGFFGEIAIIDRGPRTATVTAETPMRVLNLGPAQFQNVLRADPDMARQLLYAVVKRMRSMGTPPAD